MSKLRSQAFDSEVRTFTASAISLSLVGTVIYLAVTLPTGHAITEAQATLIGWAGLVIGFYFGGHVAQNTPAVEEARQVAATEGGEASAVRSEASAVRAETAAPDPPHGDPPAA